MPESKRIRIPAAGYSPVLLSRVMLAVSATLLFISVLISHPLDNIFTVIAAANLILQFGVLFWTLFFRSVFTVKVVDGKPIAVFEKKQQVVLTEVTKIEWKKIGRSFQLHLIEPGKNNEIPNKAVIYLTGESGINLVRKNKLSLLVEIIKATSAPRSGIDYGEDKPGYFFPNEAEYKSYQLAFIGVDEAVTELGRYVK